MIDDNRRAMMLLNNLPKQLCKLMGRMLLIDRSFFASFTKGMMMLLFHADGNDDVRMHDENSFAMSVRIGSLPTMMMRHSPVDTSSRPGADTNGASLTVCINSSSVTATINGLYHCFIMFDLVNNMMGGGGGGGIDTGSDGGMANTSVK